ncbi:hypothetical protein LOTGIDRAFT_237010 [Lottia gigantea]|uniref:CARD domain-containing protein n=1 Tax=Lottia gigantea TaxID=225164 RepID=V3ZJ86_LOTGI|nr:hypothetical protein LOTGIDRAFT_237010 [Lottia gigantea]ESO82405.1 hypothetical protein LOTGIDRAFT_237010 [Lottia gigantea]
MQSFIIHNIVLGVSNDIYVMLYKITGFRTFVGEELLMDTDNEDILRRNRTQLINDLEPNHVLGKLYEDGVLTENDCEGIRNISTQKLRCQELLALLPTRGNAAYGSFRQALEDNGYRHILNVLPKTATYDADKPTTKQREGVCEECADVIPKTTSHPGLRGIFNKHCCRLRRSLEPVDVIDYLFQERVLKDHEYDSVRVAPTRRQRCVVFFQIISKSNHPSLVHIIKSSFAKKYSFILKYLEEAGTNQGDEESEPEHYARDLNNESLKTVLNNESENRTQSDADDEPNPCSRAQKQNGCTEIIFDKESDIPGDKAPLTESKFINQTVAIKETHSCNNGPNFSLGDPEHLAISQNGGVLDRKLLVAFNSLSSYINQGQYDKFESYSFRIRQFYHSNPDMMCLLGYLHASRDLYKSDFDSAKKHIDDSLALVPQTTNGKYFTLELFGAKTRMYISRKKVEKLQSTLDDAKMIIESDPVGCTGRAAGWLYMNDARNITAQITMLNFNNQRNVKLYEMLHNQAEASFQKALSNFQRDGGKDGPFGFGYALCRLAILLLRCGDNGLTMGHLDVPILDVKRAGGYIQQLEDSPSAIPKILEVHFLLAKCDYQFRRNNPIRSLEHAEAAHELATVLNMQEFIDHAHNRLVYLRTKTPLMIEEVHDDEIDRFLFPPGVSDADASMSSD